ncbi:uncharacterized protein LOC123264164 [Cotesia glomerata]|nr:uncharacterized protein LOC123264148 [Cotesia glomerata]XP_044583251.1 uncharacterized protein LOC123264164 [Cotesia glomerata]
MIEDNCNKCRNSLKNALDTFMETMRRNRPEYYEALTDKYDPEANYFKRNNHYDKIYEGVVDVTLLLENDQVFSDELLCLLNKGPCSIEGKVLHQVLNDALLDNCMKCSRRQKEAIHANLTYLFKHYNLSQYIDVNDKDSFDKIEIISKEFLNETKVTYSVD